MTDFILDPTVTSQVMVAVGGLNRTLEAKSHDQARGYVIAVQGLLHDVIDRLDEVEQDELEQDGLAIVSEYRDILRILETLLDDDGILFPRSPDRVRALIAQGWLTTGSVSDGYMFTQQAKDLLRQTKSDPVPSDPALQEHDLHRIALRAFADTANDKGIIWPRRGSDADNALLKELETLGWLTPTLAQLGATGYVLAPKGRTVLSDEGA